MTFRRRPGDDHPNEGGDAGAHVIVGAVRPPFVASLSRGRSTRVDVLRAIAALMVIGYHTDGLIVGPTRADGLWLRYNLDTGVELFFVLSGYLIGLAFLRALVTGDDVPGTRSFARRRAARILPGYWLALGIAAFVATRQLGALPPLGLLIPQAALLQGVIPGDAGGPLVVAWTLSVEAVFYICVPVATWLLLRRRVMWSVGSLASMTCAMWAASAVLACGFATLIPASPWTTVVLRGPAGMMCQFCPGILIALLQIHSERAETHGVARARVAWTLIACGAVGWVCIAAWAGPAASTLQWVVRDQLCAVVFGLVLVGTLRLQGNEHRPTRLFARVGTVSYGMYLWHWLALEVISSTGLRLGLPLPGLFDWAFGTTLLAIATLPLALLSWHVVEKPAIRWASHRGGRRAQPPRQLAA